MLFILHTMDTKCSRFFILVFVMQTFILTIFRFLTRHVLDVVYALHTEDFYCQGMHNSDTNTLTVPLFYLLVVTTLYTHLMSN